MDSLILIPISIFMGFIICTSFTKMRQYQKVSWLILRLLDDYDREMTGQEIIDNIQLGSMGLVTIRAKSILKLIDLQATNDFVAITNTLSTEVQKTLSTGTNISKDLHLIKQMKISLTTLGRYHLAEVSALVGQEVSKRN